MAKKYGAAGPSNFQSNVNCNFVAAEPELDNIANKKLAMTNRYVIFNIFPSFSSRKQTPRLMTEGPVSISI